MYRLTHIHTLCIRNDQYDFVAAPPYFILFFSILFWPFPRRTYKYTYIHTYVRAVIYCTADPVARDPFVPPGDAPLVRARVLRQPPAGRRRSLSHTHPFTRSPLPDPAPGTTFTPFIPGPGGAPENRQRRPPRPPPIVDNDDCTPAGLIIRRRIPRTVYSTYRRRQNGLQTEHSFLTNTFIEYTFQKKRVTNRIL